MGVGIVTVALTATISVTTSAGASSAHGSVQIYQPKPTGGHSVGTTRLHLVDRLRQDPLAPKGGPRELMVQFWYPALDGPGFARAHYMPHGEAAALEGDHQLPAGSIVDAPTQAHVSPPAEPGRHPVVLFYPGLCGDRTDTTFLDEQLASQGMIVVAMSSAHESADLEFPGGRMVPSDPTICGAGQDPFSPTDQRILNRLQTVHVADTRFVLDELTRISRGIDPDVDRKPLPLGISQAMDLTRIGMFGHSTGGSTTAEVMREDSRVRAGIDLDGLILGPVLKTGLKKPFLMFGSDYHNVTEPDPSWQSFIPKLSGWHRWLRLRDAGHYRFTDLAGSSRRWGLDKTLKQASPETWNLDFGDIGDRRAMTIVATYVTAFFQRFLRARHEPLLDRPSKEFPEVQFR
ncbi:MAG TPA: hypothetical protein VHX59_11535 [Mycobacteriales bacterium]|jgi:dienelactone hydrolase|nr:hypothetical protein [Mycobacteriales bacterium]